MTQEMMLDKYDKYLGNRFDKSWSADDDEDLISGFKTWPISKESKECNDSQLWWGWRVKPIQREIQGERGLRLSRLNSQWDQSCQSVRWYPPCHATIAGSLAVSSASLLRLPLLSHSCTHSTGQTHVSKCKWQAGSSLSSRELFSLGSLL